jgi:ribosome-associated heat shock protein Hsp15
MKKQNSANTNKQNASQSNTAKADQDAKNVRIDKWL